MVRFLWLVVGVVTGVSACIFLRSEDWVLAGLFGGAALLSFILAAAAHQRGASTPSEDGTPVEGGTPRASATPPPASTP